MSQLKPGETVNLEDFEVVIELVDGTLICKRGKKSWYRISLLIGGEKDYAVETTEEKNPHEAALLDMPNSRGSREGAEAPERGLDCDHHGIIKVKSVKIPEEVKVEEREVKILRLGANYYKKSTDYGAGQRTVLDAIRDGVTV